MEEEKKKKILSKVLNKIKMSNVGKDIKENFEMPPHEEQEIIYPHLFLDSDQLSVLSNYDAGEEITLIAKGKIKSVHKDETENVSNANYEIEVRKIGCPNPLLDEDEEE